MLWMSSVTIAWTLGEMVWRQRGWRLRRGEKRWCHPSKVYMKVVVESLANRWKILHRFCFRNWDGDGEIETMVHHCGSGGGAPKDTQRDTRGGGEAHGHAASSVSLCVFSAASIFCLCVVVYVWWWCGDVVLGKMKSKSWGKWKWLN